MNIVIDLLGPILLTGERGTSKPESQMGRAVLTALALNARKPLPVDTLREAVWGADSPDSAVANVRTYIRGIRSDFATVHPGSQHTIKTMRGGIGGYLLDVPSSALVHERFITVARAGHTLLLDGRWEQARRKLRETLSLWRGRVAIDVDKTHWMISHAQGLDSLHEDVVDDLLTARIATGDDFGIELDINAGLAETPYRARRWILLVATHFMRDDLGAMYATLDRCSTVYSENLGLRVPDAIAQFRTAALNGDTSIVLKLLRLTGIRGG